MKTRIAIAAAAFLLLLVGCGKSEAQRHADQASSAMAELAADTSWVLVA